MFEFIFFLEENYFINLVLIKISLSVCMGKLSDKYKFNNLYLDTLIIKLVWPKNKWVSHKKSW